LSEERLIEELKNGSEAALETLINKYQINIYNTCLGLIQNENDAEEITQDVFIKMYQKSSSFKGDAAFSTWLYKIAVNECLQKIRSNKAQKRFGKIWDIFSNEKIKEEVIDFIHPGVKTEKKEEAKMLLKAIKELPENQRVAITLKNIEGLSQQEIASVLEVSTSAVESLLSRAKQNLKKELEKNEYEK
jgi:RNA polymerase sigma factor (sigma-70 family)